MRCCCFQCSKRVGAAKTLDPARQGSLTQCPSWRRQRRRSHRAREEAGICAPRSPQRALGSGHRCWSRSAPQRWRAGRPDPDLAPDTGVRQRGGRGVELGLTGREIEPRTRQPRRRAPRQMAEREPLARGDWKANERHQQTQHQKTDFRRCRGQRARQQRRARRSEAGAAHRTAGPGGAERRQGSWAPKQRQPQLRHRRRCGKSPGKRELPLEGHCHAEECRVRASAGMAVQRAHVRS